MVDLIVAIDNKNGIAKDGNIPWHITEDLIHFSNITKTTKDPKKRNAVIMGRITWEKIPNKFRGLKNRINIVVSKTLSKKQLDISNKTSVLTILVKSLNEGILVCKKNDNVENIFVIGGVSIYKEAIEKCLIKNAYFTLISKDFKCDKFFPMKEWNNFKNNDEYYTECCLINQISFKKVKFFKEVINFINKEEFQYIHMLKNILEFDKIGRQTRNAETFTIFGPQMEFDLTKGFPLLTTKRMFWRGIVEELLFFLKGDTNTNHLAKKGINIWKGNTCREFLNSINLYKYEEGDMGSIYGFNWRFYGTKYKGMNSNYKGKGFDQLKYVIDLIKNDPTSRRIIMTTFDPASSGNGEGVLYPCHGIIIQFFVNNKCLSCKMYQRSVDAFLGYPFNIASYALLTNILAYVTGLKPDKLIMTLGDTHIYKSHKQQVIKQINRNPFKFPNLKINKEFVPSDHKSIDNILDFIENLKFTDFKLINYKCHSRIKASMIA